VLGNEDAATSLVADSGKEDPDKDAAEAAEPDVATAGADLDDGGVVEQVDAGAGESAEDTDSEPPDIATMDVGASDEAEAGGEVALFQDTTTDGPSVADVCGPLVAGLPHVGDVCSNPGSLRCTGDGAYVSEPMSGFSGPVYYCIMPTRIECIKDALGTYRWKAAACATLPKQCAQFKKLEQPTCRETPAGARCCPIKALADENPAGGGGRRMCEVADTVQQPLCFPGGNLLTACQPFDPTPKPWFTEQITFNTCGAYCKDCLYWQPLQQCDVSVQAKCEKCNESVCQEQGWCGTLPNGTVKCAENCQEYYLFKGQAPKK